MSELTDFLSDKLGASVVTEHVSGLLILLILTGVILSSIGTIFTERSETITESELERINNKVANDIQQVDTMVNYGEAHGSKSNVEAVRRVDLAPSIGTTTYTVSVNKISDNEGQVTVQSGDKRYSQRITTDTPLEDETWGGTEGAVIAYDNSDDVISVTDPEDYSP